MGDGDFPLTRRGAMQGSAAAAGITALGSTVLSHAAMAAPAVGVGIDAAKKSDPFGKYIFGALIEHIAGGINYSLWSEVWRTANSTGRWTISRCRNPPGWARAASPPNGCRWVLKARS